jgi:hypothetical protein
MRDIIICKHPIPEIVDPYLLYVGATTCCDPIHHPTTRDCYVPSSLGYSSAEGVVYHLYFFATPLGPFREAASLTRPMCENKLVSIFGIVESHNCHD